MQERIDQKKSKDFKISNIDLTKKIVSLLNTKKDKTYLIYTSTKQVSNKKKQFIHLQN